LAADVTIGGYFFDLLDALVQKVYGSKVVFPDGKDGLEDK